MAISPTRLVLFPGLGADSRLFEPQHRGLSESVRIAVPPWLEPASENETLPAYALRMSRLIEPLAPGERLFIGGVSFGALIALEAARHLPATKAVFMIGGCRDTQAVAPFFRFACGLAPLIPIPLLKFLLRGAPAALELFESLSLDHMRLYSRMINDASPRQVRWSAGALLNYRSKGDPPGVRVRLIHGQRDLLIAPKNVMPDFVVRCGRHLVSLTHPKTVNRYLAHQMGML